MKPTTKIGKIARKVPLSLATVCIVVAGWGIVLALVELMPDWLQRWDYWQHFTISFGASAALVLLIGRHTRRSTQDNMLKHYFIFPHTLNHELAHVLFAYLTLNPVWHMTISGPVGNVQTAYRSFVVELAPYLITLPLLWAALLSAIIPQPYRPVLVVLLGSTYAYHLVSVFSSARPKQKDFDSTSYPIGLIWVCIWLLFVSGIVAGLAVGGWGESIDFLKIAWNKLFQLTVG